jgi:hypothetical protein
MLKKYYILYLSFLYLSLFVFVFICICLYGYNSGACKLNKKYICNNDFCLYKEFSIYLQDIENEIDDLIENKEIHRRVKQ